MDFTALLFQGACAGPSLKFALSLWVTQYLSKDNCGNLITLSSFERGHIKYAPCSNHALLLKRPQIFFFNGIFDFLLPVVKLQKICIFQCTFVHGTVIWLFLFQEKTTFPSFPPLYTF